MSVTDIDYVWQILYKLQLFADFLYYVINDDYIVTQNVTFLTHITITTKQSLKVI